MKPMNNCLIFPVEPLNRSISTFYPLVLSFIIRSIVLSVTSTDPSDLFIVALAIIA